LGIGDWGLGIGDWAQSPIPNPQSPFDKLKIIFILNEYFKIKNYLINKILKFISSLLFNIQNKIFIIYFYLLFTYLF